MNPSFDYIVVGAGSAGCVVASRLSEDAGCSVLLLEAGGKDSHPFLKMPVAFLKAMLDPRFGWGYMSEPEPTLGGRPVWLPRGRVLGGSSSINGNFYMRSHPRDYERYKEAGCTGWGYADVLPYFKRMEQSWRGDNAFHSGRGPLAVRAIEGRHVLHRPIMDSAAPAGYRTTEDINGALPEGFALGETTTDRRGRRASSARAYLHPALGRANLTLETRAQVLRVIVENGRATGVEYIQGGEKKIAHARREVVLSGGTYNSPHLLMLSGIGPAGHLREHGIEVKQDLPGVGRNLSEHACALVEFEATRPVTFLKQLRLDRAIRWTLQWALFGSGPFATQINSCNIVIRSAAGLDRPDVQLMSNPVRLDADIWVPFFSKARSHVFSIWAVALHPRSRGWVTLRSADPLAPPRIQLNLFAEAEDLATIRRGIRETRRIYRGGAQAELTGKELTPACDDDAELDAYARQTAITAQHPVGTCAMGVGADAVVDPQLRVRGIAGLRVADASILPEVPGGNTNSHAIMIGEMAADLIRGRRLPPEPVAWRES